MKSAEIKPGLVYETRGWDKFIVTEDPPVQVRKVRIYPPRSMSSHLVERKRVIGRAFNLTTGEILGLSNSDGYEPGQILRCVGTVEEALALFAEREEAKRQHREAIAAQGKRAEKVVARLKKLGIQDAYNRRNPSGTHQIILSIDAAEKLLKETEDA